jgi:hypothetical protein
LVHPSEQVFEAIEPVAPEGASGKRCARLSAVVG